MKWWMRERDQLIEQTMAFVEGVTAARPVRAEPSPKSEPAPKPEPAPAVEASKPAAPAFMASERAEIEKRVANFKAHQQKFQREREEHYNAVFAKTRAAPGNPTRP
jgi:flagellar biosynthesis/type III secretory pathway protein FliH